MNVRMSQEARQRFMRDMGAAVIDITTMQRNLRAPRSGDSPARAAYAGFRASVEHRDGGLPSRLLAGLIGVALGVVLTLWLAGG